MWWNKTVIKVVAILYPLRPIWNKRKNDFCILLLLFYNGPSQIPPSGRTIKQKINALIELCEQPRVTLPLSSAFILLHCSVILFVNDNFNLLFFCCGVVIFKAKKTIPNNGNPSPSLPTIMARDEYGLNWFDFTINQEPNQHLRIMNSENQPNSYKA